ncbi:MAG: AAA family ATPase [Tannerella sp.]|jgi:hypothetical protein|nr:AAA family ATPase [Tannerella sp.]
MQTNPQLDLAKKFVMYTGQNIFLTGKAGTGKTTFLHHLRETAPKRMVVVAPTGVAAINARGVTIHSFFQLPPKLHIDFANMKPEQMRFSREKINIIRSLDLLVIDEISMVRADLLDAVDATLRRFRHSTTPFGGVQLLMIGDLQQLSPVVKDDESALLKEHYDTPYFFSSKALQKTSFVGIELTQVFRQQDNRFISMLNKVRSGDLDGDALDMLNKRYIPDFSPKDEDGYITLCTHNFQAHRINESKLNSIPGRAYHYKAEIHGTFPEYSYPTDSELTLKEKAQVMFVKNDLSPEKRYYNGKIGKITRIGDKEIRVLCPGEPDEIAVTPQKWENVRYSLNDETQEIREDIEGSFEQFPLKPAWAITIHKSQGLTFERAVIDAEASFAHGQVYVALSRCKTLEGMVLRSPISQRSIVNDHAIKGFTQQIEQSQPDENMYLTVSKAYQHELLKDLFQFATIRSRISYIDRVIGENRGSLTGFTLSIFAQMINRTRPDIIEVAERFQLQINALLSQQSDIEKNETLQKRIGQASEYFSTKINEIILEPLTKADLDIDNKAVKKQLNDAVTNFENDARLKHDSMLACLSGFKLSEYLHARAIAAIQKDKPKEKRTFTPAENGEIENPALFNRLRAWRTKKAEEIQKPAFTVFSQKTLYELVHFMPTDRKSLSQINGIGPAKIENYGKDIISIIMDYNKANEI